MRVPGNFTNPDLNELARAIGQLARGRTNACGTITLTTSSTTTTVEDVSIEKGDRVSLTALDANAAAETIHVEDGAATAGQITLTHANSGTTRKFLYQVCGGRS